MHDQGVKKEDRTGEGLSRLHGSAAARNLLKARPPVRVWPIWRVSGMILPQGRRYILRYILRRSQVQIESARLDEAPGRRVTSLWRCSCRCV